MSINRFAEYRHIDDANVAGKYRRSFVFYSEETLLLSCFFMLSRQLFCWVFLIKYHIEYLMAIVIPRAANFQDELKRRSVAFYEWNLNPRRVHNHTSTGGFLCFLL